LNNRRPIELISSLTIGRAPATIKRHHIPDADADNGHCSGHDGGRHQSGYDVNDQENTAHNRGEQKVCPDYCQHGGHGNEFGFSILSKDQSVINDRRGKQHYGHRTGRQRDCVDHAVTGQRDGESRRKWQREQKCEQNLHARLRDPNLLQQLAEVPVKSLVRCLIPAPVGAHGISHASPQLMRSANVGLLP
jgi:hypothetical protein